jgi:ketosteroid isomerase-like protein
MNAAQVVEQLWSRMQARDWAAVGALLAEDVIVEWPASAERIRGRKNYLAVNSEYPEGWSVHIMRIVPGSDGEQVVTEVDVPQEGVGLFRAVSFWTVRDGLIVSGREYWSTPGADPSPEWRAPYVERIPVA